MWKFYFYSQWQYSKAETWLEMMEAKGFRLVDIKFFCFFRFKKVSPKKVQYLFTYTFPKDSTWEHYEMLQKVKGEFCGNQIGKNHIFAPDVYRICNLDANLKTVRMFWQQYLKRVFLLKMLIASIVFLPTMFLSFFQLFQTVGAAEMILICTASISFLTFLYYLFGLLMLGKRSK